jgi:hypothetical protein
VVFRADAAFAKPEIYEALEEREVKYAIRLPANDNLERDIAELLTRPVGRPSYKPVTRFKSFLYRAASWKTARRVVAKVEFHFGELFPRVGYAERQVICASGHQPWSGLLAWLSHQNCRIVPLSRASVRWQTCD